MVLIAGPCVIEDYEMLNVTAKVLSKVVKNLDIDFYFKSSCIKDNRTKVENFRGVGFKQGIEWLEKIRGMYDVKICTDFHNIDQLKKWSDRVDLIQIPAFLGRQVSMLECAAQQNKTIHLKKPQFMSYSDVQIPIKILQKSGAEKIFLTDRGTYSGEFLTMDPRSVEIMKAYLYEDPNVKILADITHPNKGQNLLSDRLARNLGKAYIAAGADGLFLETHPNMQQALCDEETMLSLESASKYITEFYLLKKFIDANK
jgi:2-dehydro-3-deoxyphosphooctonate aldolase (KDO 8-P synthase)